MIEKIARSIEMSFDIPSTELEIAKKALLSFKQVQASLDVAKIHLNNMYDPFKAAQSIPDESLYEYRGAINKYRKTIEQNFNKVKEHAFLAVKYLTSFSSDTHVNEIINAFKDSIQDLFNQLNVLFDVFKNLKQKDFKDIFIKAVDSLRTSCFELDKLINERVNDYLNNNILGNNWVDDISHTLNEHIEERVPYITQLYQERNNITKK